MIEQFQSVAKAVFAVFGSVSVLASLLSHVVPWRPVASFFARIGVATGKFRVEHK